MKKNLSATSREQMSKVFKQAKDSIKLLELLEKEALSKAKSFVKLPRGADRKKLTNAKILSSLKKLGVATQEEVLALRDRIEQLEGQLSAHESSSGHKKKNSAPQADAIPQG